MYHGYDPELLYSELHTSKHWKMQYKSIDTLKDSVINFNKVYKTLGKSDEQGPVAVRTAKGRRKEYKRWKPAEEIFVNKVRKFK